MYYSRATDNKDLLKIAERAALSLGVLGGREVESFGICVERSRRSLPMNTSDSLHANPLQVVIIGMVARDKAALLFDVVDVICFNLQGIRLNSVREGWWKMS